MAGVFELSDLKHYEQELEKPGLFIIDFYSTQCPPCKVIAPFYEKIAKKPSTGDSRFFKINGLEEPGSTVQQTAKVVWWPTIVIYEGGQEIWRRKIPNPPSLVPIEELEKFLDERQPDQSDGIEA